MKVRKASPEDAENIDHVIKETWVDAYSSIEPEQALEEIRTSENLMDIKDLREWIKDDSTVYLVAEKEGEIVGEAILVLSGGEEFVDYPSDAFLRSLYVLPDHQGTGIGTALLEKTKKEVSDRNNLKTMVLSENSSGKKFYEKKGFSITGKTSFGGEEDSILGKQHTAVILEKKLSEEI